MAYLETLAEKKSKVDELMLVYDNALSGATEINISDPSGGSVTYRNVNPDQLRIRIRELQAEIAAIEGTAQPRTRVPLAYG